MVQYCFFIYSQTHVSKTLLLIVMAVVSTVFQYGSNNTIEVRATKVSKMFWQFNTNTQIDHLAFIEIFTFCAFGCC